jgi:hypothetical protein
MQAFVSTGYRMSRLGTLDPKRILLLVAPIGDFVVTKKSLLLR